MPTSVSGKPTDLTSRGSPPAHPPAAHPSAARLAHPNHKSRGASPWPGGSLKPLSGGGAVASVAQERRNSVIGLARRLSSVSTASDQPCPKSLSDVSVAAAAQERRNSLIGLARKVSSVGTATDLSDLSDQVAGEPRREPRVLSLASMRQTSLASIMRQTNEPAVSGGLWLGANAVHLLRWCLLVVVGINVLAFPFLLSFVGPVSPSNNQTWFAVLLACDVVLWLDVASRFVTPQWEGGDDGEETRLSHRRV